VVLRIQIIGKGERRCFIWARNLLPSNLCSLLMPGLEGDDHLSKKRAKKLVRPVITGSKSKAGRLLLAGYIRYRGQKMDVWRRKKCCREKGGNVLNQDLRKHRLLNGWAKKWIATMKLEKQTITKREGRIDVKKEKSLSPGYRQQLVGGQARLLARGSSQDRIGGRKGVKQPMTSE